MRFKLAAFADEASAQISEQIQAMVDNDIDYLEIRGVDGINISDITVEKAKQVRKQLDDHGLRVWSLGSPYGKIGINDDFVPHLERFKHGLELAHVLGAGNIRMFSFYVPEGEALYYRDMVMQRLEAFCGAARGSGVVLCHENEKGIYGESAARCLEIHQTFPQIKAVFDTANFIQSGQDTIQAWELLFPYVKYLHIKDAMPNGAVVPAGKGVGNIPYILERFKGEMLTLEPHLTVFPGFEKLEAVEKTKMGFCYGSARLAFDAAVAALKELL